MAKIYLHDWAKNRLSVMATMKLSVMDTRRLWQKFSIRHDYINNKAKAISAELLELNLKNKLE